MVIHEHWEHVRLEQLRPAELTPSYTLFILSLQKVFIMYYVGFCENFFCIFLRLFYAFST